MEYTKSVGDIYETFIGTPEEIAELMQLMQQDVQEVEKEVIRNKECELKYICDHGHLSQGIVKHILKLQEEYHKEAGTC